MVDSEKNIRICKMPTRAEALLAIAASNYTNTGRKNSKGRRVFTGLRGGLFVFAGNQEGAKKLYRIAQAKKTSEVIGQNEKGRNVYMGPSGGKYVKVNGKKRYLKK
jgi:hypothetical protein